MPLGSIVVAHQQPLYWFTGVPVSGGCLFCDPGRTLWELRILVVQYYPQAFFGIRNGVQTIMFVIMELQPITVFIGQHQQSQMFRL